MNPDRLLEGYARRLRDSRKALDGVVRRAERLSDQRNETEAQRADLASQIEATKQTLTELRTEDEELKPELLESMMQDDTVQQRELKQRRKAIADAIRERESEIEQLTASLEQLPGFDQDAVEVAIELDGMNAPEWWRFLDEMKDSLRRSAAAFDSKRDEARRNLPAFDRADYHELRMEQDEDYRRKQEFEEYENQALQARLERNRKSLADAQKQHVGTGNRGTKRAASIKESTDKIKASRR